MTTNGAPQRQDRALVPDRQHAVQRRRGHQRHLAHQHAVAGRRGLARHRRARRSRSSRATLIEIEITGIGVLRNRVVAEASGANGMIIVDSQVHVWPARPAGPAAHSRRPGEFALPLRAARGRHGSRRHRLRHPGPAVIRWRPQRLRLGSRASMHPDRLAVMGRVALEAGPAHATLLAMEGLTSQACWASD